MTKTNTLTGNTGALSIPPVEHKFMFIETKGNNYGQHFVLSFERTGFIQISNSTFYFYRFPAGNSQSIKRFQNQLRLPDRQRFSN